MHAPARVTPRRPPSTSCLPSSSEASATRHPPTAAVLQAAGGHSSDGRGSILDMVVHSNEDRSAICVGSAGMVVSSREAMAASHAPSAPAGPLA